MASTMAAPRVSHRAGVHPSACAICTLSSDQSQTPNDDARHVKYDTLINELRSLVFETHLESNARFRV
jgi:hypothetical protein